jgi:hypothetical protein
MKFIILTAIIILYANIGIESKPQYSMLSGNKCVNCHFNNHGGSQRNSLGWYSRQEVAIIEPAAIGLEKLYETIGESNSDANEIFYYGADYRLQVARLGGPEGTKRKIFSMQFSPYLAVKPFDWLTAYGHYNFIEALYPGQKKWSASMIIHPSYDLPYFKLGYIQPSIGTRYDDHTLLIRQVTDAFRAHPIIPPDYAEIGAEINYEAIRWLSLTFGAYGAKSMAENSVTNLNGEQIPLINSESVSTLARAEIWQRFFEDAVNASIGSSYFWNDDLSILNFYLYLGLTDNLSLLTEYVITDKMDIRKTNSFMVELAYQVVEPIVLSARIEKAGTENFYNDTANKTEFTAWQYVIGANLFLFRNVELRPEYRIYDREHVPGYSAQWAMQLHLYY